MINRPLEFKIFNKWSSLKHLLRILENDLFYSEKFSFFTESFPEYSYLSITIIQLKWSEIDCFPSKTSIRVKNPRFILIL